MSHFHDVNLPHFLAIHAKGGPSFATSHVITASGREIRSADRIHAAQHYVIEGCRLSHEQFDEFNAFFRARLGSGFAFRLRDYADCKITDQLIAMGDNRSKQFELYKTYKSDAYTYQRRITKLYRGDVCLLIDETEISPNFICLNTGMITLDSILTEGKSLMLKNAIFDVPVRFSNDNFKYSVHADGSIIIDNLHLIEVIDHDDLI